MLKPGKLLNPTLIAICLLWLAAPAKAGPCGTLAFNPITGNLDCTGQFQSVAAAGFPLTGLLGYYRMVDSTGTTLVDSSSNGNNGTLVGSPTIGTSGITFARGTQYATLPAAVSSSAHTVMVCADFSTNIISSAQSALWGSATANKTSFVMNGSQQFFSSMMNPVLITSSPQTELFNTAPPQACFTVVTTNALNDTVYVNNLAIGQYKQRGSSFSAMHVDQLASHLSGTEGFSGTIFFAAMWSGSLTAAQAAQAYNAVWNGDIIVRRGYAPYVNTSTSNVLICMGDSRAAGSATGIGYCGTGTTLAPTDTYTFYTMAESGATNSGLTLALDQLDILRAPLAQHPCVVIEAGIDDILGGFNTAQTEANTSALGLAIKRHGCQVIVATSGSYVNATGCVGGSSCDPIIAAVNTWIRSNWQSFADGLADPASDKRIGCLGCSSNTVYFFEGETPPVHYTLTGEHIVNQYFQDAVNKLNGLSPCLMFRIKNSNPALNVASTTATVPIFTLPANAKITSAWVKHSTQFTSAPAAGGTLTGLTVSMGTAAGGATFITSAQQVLSTAVSNTAFVDFTGPAKSAVMGATDVVNLVFTATGGANMGIASTNITGATNAALPVYTTASISLAVGDQVFISGFSVSNCYFIENSGSQTQAGIGAPCGITAADNETCTVISTNLTATTFSCSGAGSLNSVAAGAAAGSPTITANFFPAGEVDAGLCYQMTQ